MTYQLLEVNEKYDRQVAEILLKAPPANILNAAMMAELSSCLDQQAKVAQRKLLILSGSGAHFCYGASVEEHLPAQVNEMLTGFHRLIGKLVNFEIPTLAKVSGQCLGGGFELALSCSFLYADETAKFAVPEIQLGVFPPVAAALLPAQCGQSFVNSMVVLGEKVTAQELLPFGIVSRLIEKDGWDTFLKTFIEEKILPKSASSLRFAHRAARMHIVKRYQDLITPLENLYLKDLMSTKDATEGLKSFLEKRPVKWSNA